MFLSLKKYSRFQGYEMYNFLSTPDVFSFRENKISKKNIFVHFLIRQKIVYTCPKTLHLFCLYNFLYVVFIRRSLCAIERQKL